MVEKFREENQSYSNHLLAVDPRLPVALARLDAQLLAIEARLSALEAAEGQPGGKVREIFNNTVTPLATSGGSASVPNYGLPPTHIGSITQDVGSGLTLKDGWPVLNDVAKEHEVINKRFPWSGT